jgi:hypothetical protein
MPSEGSVSVRSKPTPFAEKKNAKSAAPPRVEIATELNAAVARNGWPPAGKKMLVVQTDGGTVVSGALQR